MAQKKFHINDAGMVERCRNPRCNARGKIRNHWAEAEHARIHLDNIAFLAEVAAEVAAFRAVAGNMQHPKHFRAIFSQEKHNDNIRKFRERMDNYVAYYGEKPSYLAGSVRYRLKHWRWRHEIFFNIQVTPVIETERGITSRLWKATVTEVDETQYDSRKKEKTLHEIELSFDNHKDFDANIAKLKEAYEIALKATGKHHLDNYAEFTDPMIKKFWEMFDAIEGVAQGDMDIWYNLGRGDFRNSHDGKIVVDVNYDKSTFTGQSFIDFVQRNLTFGDRFTDAEVRVTDEVDGHPRASWSLYRKDGIWSVATRTFEGEKQDNLTPTSEDVRSHVYWHVFREININNQEEALKKADYAAAVFNAVEAGLVTSNGIIADA